MSFKDGDPPGKSRIKKLLIWLRQPRYETEVRYESSLFNEVNPKCEQLLWVCLTEARDARLRLTPRPQKIAATAIYLLLVYLLKSIEPVRSPDSAGLRPNPEQVDACIAVVVLDAHVRHRVQVAEPAAPVRRARRSRPRGAGADGLQPRVYAARSRGRSSSSTGSTAMP
jgi:hypothetical protein